MLPEDDPNLPTEDYKRMAEDWKTISDILEGAKKVRSETTRYLPMYPGELQDEYTRRVAMTPWRAEFEDALRTLASKPFEREIMLGEDTPEPIKELAENIDARGDDLTAFCRDPFKMGVAKGLHAILVDYPNINPRLTVRQEKEAGARPYWVSIPAEAIISLITKVINGVEEIIHIRFRECRKEQVGKFGMKETPLIRVFNRSDEGVITWEIYKKTELNSIEWLWEAGGTVVGQKKIPIALFFCGDRSGSHMVRPPLMGLADMQIELYRALSRKDEIETYAGSPMLEGKGIDPPGVDDAPLLVGPKRILIAPPALQGGQTGWSYIQPSADNMRELRESVRDLIEDLRRLGLQPMVQKSGGITATATSIDGAKAHTTIEAWAVLFEDCIERAMEFTCAWLGRSDVITCIVHKDFSVVRYEQVPLDTITKARERGDISVETFWDTCRRFDVLRVDFDPKQEKTRLDAEKTTKLEDKKKDLELVQSLTPEPKEPING